MLLLYGGASMSSVAAISRVEIETVRFVKCN